MQFDSFEYALFFPVVTTAFFVLPQRWRWVLLLSSSYVFYGAWDVRYLALIWASTLLDYAVGILIERTSGERARRRWLWASLASNLGILFTFKYFNFFVDSAHVLAERLGWEVSLPTLQLLLPVGISFYTFQSLSYTIEVYLGRCKAERHLGIFALYIAFFPQLVAGPIERPGHLLPQFRLVHSFNQAQAVSGLRLILWGLFKKMVVSDNLALVVEQVYGSGGGTLGPFVAIGTVFFAFQIYCDFSGYSDIAVGSARFLGFDLMSNFNRPYASRTITDFWRRWHISLSTWFRDYVYIPLGGNRSSSARWAVNIMIVFVASGLWHGANWTFVIWGALHGSYLVAERFLRGATAKPPAGAAGLFAWFITFCLVCVTWIFFRAQSLHHALGLIAALPFGWEYLWMPGGHDVLSNVAPASFARLASCFGLIVLVNALERSAAAGGTPYIFRSRFMPLRWAAYLAATLALLYGGVDQEMPFIYFQF